MVLTRTAELLTWKEKFEKPQKNSLLKHDLLLILNQSNQIKGFTAEKFAFDAKTYQKKLFRAEYFPEKIMSPQAAHWEFLKNNTRLVKLGDIVGEIALEGALPYPPGVYCVVPGERWNEVAQKYFLILEESINRFPGFGTEIQGVYLEKEGDQFIAYGYVLDRK